MSWDGTKTRDERDLDPTFAHDLGQARIAEIRPFELLPTTSTAVLERTNPARQNTEHTSDIVNNSLEVTEFTEECSSAHDAKAGPKTPHEATEDRDNLVTEELCVQLAIRERRRSEGA